MTVSVSRILESDTVRIPEAAAMVGQSVRITVEEAGSPTSPGVSEGLAWDGMPYDAQRLVEAMDLARGVEFDDAAVADLDRRSVL